MVSAFFLGMHMCVISAEPGPHWDKAFKHQVVTAEPEIEKEGLSGEIK